MRRLLAAILIASFAFGGSALAASFPTPAPATVVPSAGGSGVSGPAWAYCYVNEAGAYVPANSTSVLCAVTLGPGVWRLSGIASVLLNPGTGTSQWSADLISAKGGTAYYGASTGSVASLAQIVCAPVLGLALITETTEVHLRWWSNAPATFVASTFDTGPTVYLIAERLSESTAPLP